MLITDTHTHLFAAEFDPDRDQLISQAIEKGVRRFFLPNIDVSSVSAMLDLSEKYPQHCFPMIGLHPCSVTENYLDQLNELFTFLKKAKFYGIGEIGIDLYWDKSLVEQQKEAFVLQIEKAVETDMPVVIHSRESFDLIIEVINETYQKNNWSPKQLRGIFHCFTGTHEQARTAIDLGFYLGIGGVVTFKKSGLEEVVKQIDIEYLVLETDAPYLAPTPFRGKRNIPEYIINIAEKVAEIKAVSLEEVARITSENAEKIFRIK